MTERTLPALATIEGCAITHASMRAVVDDIAAAAARREGFAVFTLNLDHLVKLGEDQRFRRAYAQARFVTADGAPVAALARLQNRTIERVTGADLVLPLAEAAAQRGLKLFLFGTSPETLGKAGVRLAANCAGALDIVGSFSPAQGFDPESAEADAALDRIASSGAQICLVALGAPKQEILAARAVARGIKVGFVCIGAALDFLSGEQVRAPRLLRDHGLEWIWRLATNPRRLAVRYARCAALLARLVIVGPRAGAQAHRAG